MSFELLSVTQPDLTVDSHKSRLYLRYALRRCIALLGRCVVLGGCVCVVNCVALMCGLLRWYDVNERDNERAFEFLSFAADAGNAAVNFYLGTMYREGCGVDTACSTVVSGMVQVASFPR